MFSSLSLWKFKKKKEIFQNLKEEEEKKGNLNTMKMKSKPVASFKSP